ncbi:hypothetical protein [Thermococcus sp.]|uniref:hypothetical protein n=1 Tax=Thermococcus sp. TaxID=35749 RepID=UPI00261FD4C3|nr:hypothetical protein [Thermococcus sp.]
MRRVLDFGYEFDCYLLELEGPSGSVTIKAEFEPKYLKLTITGENFSSQLLLKYTRENVQKLAYLYWKYAGHVEGVNVPRGIQEPVPAL